MQRGGAEAENKAFLEGNIEHKRLTSVKNKYTEAEVTEVEKQKSVNEEPVKSTHQMKRARMEAEEEVLKPYIFNCTFCSKCQQWQKVPTAPTTRSQEGNGCPR